MPRAAPTPGCAWTAAPISEYRATEKLRDGTVATLRSIRPDDKERLLRAFRALEPESVYRRVFSAKSDLSAEELRRLTELDPGREAALVATLEDEIIGVGRYVVAGDGAEVAFTVEEDYQGLGIATRLLRHLVTLARKSGIREFEAFVLPGNSAMLGVFERSGLAARVSRQEGQLRVKMRL